MLVCYQAQEILQAFEGREAELSHECPQIPHCLDWFCPEYHFRGSPLDSMFAVAYPSISGATPTPRQNFSLAYLSISGALQDCISALAYPCISGALPAHCNSGLIYPSISGAPPTYISALIYPSISGRNISTEDQRRYS